MTWQLGRTRETSGEVDVRFEPTGANSCRVTLVHGGWDRMGAEGPPMRAGYDVGWGQVFAERFADYARAG